MISHRKERLAQLAAGLKLKNEAAGRLVEDEVKKVTPVDTGRLRASITHESDLTGATIGTNVEYAPFVELGTRYQDPNPFLVNGLNNSRSRLIAIFTTPIGL